MYKSIEELRFNVTEDMNNTMIELLLIKEMLKKKPLTKKHRRLLENHMNELREHFISEFKKNNTEQVKCYNELMNK